MTATDIKKVNRLYQCGKTNEDLFSLIKVSVDFPAMTQSIGYRTLLLKVVWHTSVYCIWHVCLFHPSPVLLKVIGCRLISANTPVSFFCSKISAIWTSMKCLEVLPLQTIPHLTQKTHTAGIAFEFQTARYVSVRYQVPVCVLQMYCTSCYTVEPYIQYI